MPKLRQPLEKTKNQELLALIVMRQKLYGVNNYDLAAALKCHANTVTKRLKQPEEFTLKELRQLCDTLHFTEQERNSILSKDKYL